MGIYKQKDSKGKLSRYYYYDFKSNGTRFKGSTGCTLERDAKKFFYDKVAKLKQQTTAKAVTENFRDVLSGGKTILLDEAFARFIDKPKKRSICEDRVSNKRAQWQDFLNYVNDNYPEIKNLSDVNRHIAEAYINRLRKSGKYDKNVEFQHNGRRKTIAYTLHLNSLSPATCNAYHATLQQIFDVLFYDASLIENPFKSIPKLNNDYQHRDVFSPNELKLIGEKTKGDEFLYPIFAIGINTGLREGDICQLRWSEFDLVGGWISHKMAKTGKTVRIPILPTIREYFNILSAQRLDNEFVLPVHAEMYRANRTGIGYRVSKFLKSMGIKTTKKVDGRSREVSVKDVHSLRHTFCYLAWVHDVPYLIIKSIVGHVNSQVTEMYMNHASDEMKKLKLQYLPDYLGLPQASNSLLPAITKESQLIQILKSMTPKNVAKLRQQALQILGEPL